MTNTETAATDYPVRIGNGHQVHRANADGNVFCGSQRRGHRAVSFLAADTAITCTKCGPAETEAPAAAPTGRTVVDGKCTNEAEHPGQVIALSRFGYCGVCD